MMSLFFNAHKLPSIDLVIEHSKYFSVPLKIVSTEALRVTFLFPFLAKACLSAEHELLNTIFTHILLTVFFVISFTRVSSVRA